MYVAVISLLMMIIAQLNQHNGLWMLWLITTPNRWQSHKLINCTLECEYEPDDPNHELIYY
jgi:hypothetical protein